MLIQLTLWEQFTKDTKKRVKFYFSVIDAKLKIILSTVLLPKTIVNLSSILFCFKISNVENKDFYVYLNKFYFR